MFAVREVEFVNDWWKECQWAFPGITLTQFCFSLGRFHGSNIHRRLCMQRRKHPKGVSPRCAACAFWIWHGFLLKIDWQMKLSWLLSARSRTICNYGCIGAWYLWSKSNAIRRFRKRNHRASWVEMKYLSSPASEHWCATIVGAYWGFE